MAKYDVWVRVWNDYIVTVEGDSLEAATDKVYENPPPDCIGNQTWYEGGVDITHYQEVDNYSDVWRAV